MNHNYSYILYLCVQQWMLQKEKQFMNAAEIREPQRDTYITLPHVERCEVNDVLCNNRSIFLPHLCCQNSQDLTASLSFHTYCIRSARHVPALALSNTKNIFIYRQMCVCVCVCSQCCAYNSCSVYWGWYPTWCSVLKRLKKYEAPDKMCKGKNKMEASEKLWKHALLKPDNIRLVSSRPWIQSGLMTA